MRPASLTAAAPPSNCQETHKVATVAMKISNKNGVPTISSLVPRFQCR